MTLRQEFSLLVCNAIGNMRDFLSPREPVDLIVESVTGNRDFREIETPEKREAVLIALKKGGYKDANAALNGFEHYNI